MMVHRGYRGMQGDARLITEGIVTRADVVQTASDTIGLRFTLSDGTVRTLVPDRGAPKMKPGQYLEIIYPPENPQAGMRVQAMEDKARAVLLAHQRSSW